MISKEFFQALDALELEKNIKKEFFLQALESGLTAAYKKTYGEAKRAVVKLFPEKNMIRVYSYKEIVETVEDPDKEISLEEAKLIKKSYKIGDTIMQEENTKDFGRIPSQTVKQVIMQKLREATMEQEAQVMTDKEGELVTGLITREDGDTYHLNLGNILAEGVLSVRDQIPGEKLHIGERIKVYVRKVVESFSGMQVQVSRTNQNFVRKLFELEVPEIASGEVEIVGISREAGYRTKMAVKSNNPDFDAVGACVGYKGVRVNPIVSELNGEKIDIIAYSDDAAEYIANALSPAKVISVTVNEDEKISRAIVPDDKLSLAIGKDGHNVRLAARLTGWKIDVKSESQSGKINEIKQENDVNIDFESTNVSDDIFGDIEEI